MTIYDAAAHLGISRTTIYTAIKRGNLPCTEVPTTARSGQRGAGGWRGMAYRVVPEELLAWWERHRNGEFRLKRTTAVNHDPGTCIVDGSPCATDEKHCSGCRHLVYEAITTCRASGHNPHDINYGKRKANGITGPAYNGR